MTHNNRPSLLQGTLAAVFAASVLAPVSAEAGLSDWTTAVSAGTSASFVATNIFTPSVANIGALSGNKTYEFIVNGGDGATAGSLLGSLTGGQSEAIRFEQWQNTGTYGATRYFIADYDFGVATTFDTDVHLAFVVDGAAGTTALFVNGVNTGATVPFALTLNGLVAFGGTDVGGGGFLGDDAFAGTIHGFAAYDEALSAEELKVHSDAFFAAVPEPATWALFGAGLLGLAGQRWKKRIAARDFA